MTRSVLLSMDGVWCGGPDGKLYEVFDPKWWRLDRWLWWWFFTKRAAKGNITLTLADPKGIVRKHDVRVVQIPRRRPS